MNNFNKDKPYLPKARTGYFPTENHIENNVEQAIDMNLPNPATDPIVVNNIAWQEFDYTEDLTDEIIPPQKPNNKI